jgi:hypothetical protein
MADREDAAVHSAPLSRRCDFRVRAVISSSGFGVVAIHHARIIGHRQLYF